MSKKYSYHTTGRREGVFLYEKIKEVLHIDEGNDILESQIRGIYNLVDTSQEFTFNKMALVLSVFGESNSSFHGDGNCK